MKFILFFSFIFLTSIVISQDNSSNEVIESKKTDGISKSIEDKKTNTIEYETLATKEGFQIRKYPELTVASTELSSNSYSNNSSVGFRKIASYIFGGNSSNEQIAMTSPVQMNLGSSPTMSFFMPANRDPKDLPIPNRNDVSLRIQPSQIVAVIAFSGWASDRVLKKQFSLLKEKLKKESIEFDDSYSFLGYNPPYKLINRKNEVIIPLTNYKTHMLVNKIN
tara:strand:- start:2815 stop:3480 length:666 start_codon:yes stop_codon:yes gene_type:complete